MEIMENNMKRININKTIIALSSSVLLATSLISLNANAAIDADAAIIKLRTSCTENGNAVDNCFTDLPAMNTWIWSTRTTAPDPENPLKIEVGPGTFNGTFTCNSESWNGENFGSVTIQGSGINNTTLQNASGPISTTYCHNLVFSDMTLKNYGNLFGVKNLGGSTVWKNIRIEGIGYAWFDSPTACNANGSHYWFNSTIVATTAAGSTKAYYTGCDESWFFGSELIAISSSGISQPIQANGGKVHVYGSVIRALPSENNSAIAVESLNGGEVHLHGTGIDVIGTGANNITALSTSTGGSIHANESSYVMKTGTGGTKTRVSNNGGSIAAPYQWQNGDTPPDVNTETGYDTVVITNTSDNHPHMVISDNTCASKWYDINSSACM